MRPAATVAGAAWVAANWAGYWKYRRALANPAETQQAILMSYLAANAGSDFGRQHGFDTIRSIEQYQARVPVASYPDFAHQIEQIAQGRPRVLTEDAVTHLGVSSGSASAAKLIPYTRRLQQEFRRAIAPWIVDLYSRWPRAAFGSAYWSITPAATPRSPSAIPVGFGEDTEYVGGLAKRIVEATLAVPGGVSLIRDIETFRYVTLLFLLRRLDLTVISVWHPSFLTLLLSALRMHWASLVSDVRHGTVTLPSGASISHMPGRRLRPCPARADSLEQAGPDGYRAIWPQLSVVSCWADGHAALHVEELKRMMPHVAVQPKGLMATEAVVTLPFENLTPVALRSHFFEFLAEGRAWLSHELVPGKVYSVVVTTGGGLYRYGLQDRVEVNGFVAKTPSLRFLGKEDHVSDLCGEKLNEEFVAGAVARACAEARVAPTFALVAPDLDGSPARYALYVEVDTDLPPNFERLVDDLLSANPHYRYCRTLGQLGPLHVVRGTAMFPRYAGRCLDSGQRLGDVKALALSARGGWAEIFARAG